MCPLPPPPIILGMTRPITASKVLLVEDRRVTPPSRDSAPVRRYRIARLRFDPPPATGASRFEHLKRTYD